MTRGAKLIRTLAGLVISLVLAYLGFAWFIIWLRGPFDSGYAAADYDPRVTQVAATATPLIAAIERYHDDHSTFPAHVTDFVSYISTSPPAQPAAPGSHDILGWHYMQFKKGSFYTLYQDVGFDSTLVYIDDGSEARWVFDPGDGNPKKTILLKP